MNAAISSHRVSFTPALWPPMDVADLIAGLSADLDALGPRELRPLRSQPFRSEIPEAVMAAAAQVEQAEALTALGNPATTRLRVAT